MGDRALKRVQAFQSRNRSYNTEGVRIADLEQLTKLMKSNRVKWGFIWIILASLLWGFSYVPQEAIWSIEPLGTLWYNGGADLLEATIVLASMQSLMFTIVLFLLWSCVNNKPREAFRMARSSPRNRSSADARPRTMVMPAAT